MPFLQWLPFNICSDIVLHKRLHAFSISDQHWLKQTEQFPNILVGKSSPNPLFLQISVVYEKVFAVYTLPPQCNVSRVIS